MESNKNLQKVNSENDADLVDFYINKDTNKATAESKI